LIIWELSKSRAFYSQMRFISLIDDKMARVPNPDSEVVLETPTESSVPAWGREISDLMRRVGLAP
jgi:hypothetical protein